MERISRRSFFKVAGAPVAATAAEARALTGPTASPSSSIPSTTYTFFNPDEARFIEAAVERLIPVDENGPGAIDASVPNYLAKQLAGAWGAGERLYRGGPWHEGAPTQGYQLSFTPAELFRNALRGITNNLQKRGVASFAKLDPKDQDAYPTGAADEHDQSERRAFQCVFRILAESHNRRFFIDPVYGGNNDMVACKMIGFPGAYASYYDQVDQHGIAFDRAPMSLAQSGTGTIHIWANEQQMAAVAAYYETLGAPPAEPETQPMAQTQKRGQMLVTLSVTIRPACRHAPNASWMPTLAQYRPGSRLGSRPLLPCFG